MDVISSLFKWVILASISFVSFFANNFENENCWLQQDSNLDCPNDGEDDDHLTTTKAQRSQPFPIDLCQTIYLLSKYDKGWST